MAYVSLQPAPHTPIPVRHLVRKHLDMQFADAHAMLRLPIKTDSGLRAGCNFACASWLLGPIGGASRIFNDHKRSMENGAAFRTVVCDYFPWEVSPPSDLTPNKIAGDLWKVFRNPLSHNWAVHEPGETRVVSITKRVCSERELVELERATTPPAWVRPVMTSDHLYVDGLYWASRRMVYKLTADPARMTETAAFLVKVSR